MLNRPANINLHFNSTADSIKSKTCAVSAFFHVSFCLCVRSSCEVCDHINRGVLLCSVPVQRWNTGTQVSQPLSWLRPAWWTCPPHFWLTSQLRPSHLQMPSHPSHSKQILEVQFCPLVWRSAGLIQKHSIDMLFIFVALETMKTRFILFKWFRLEALLIYTDWKTSYAKHLSILAI